MLIFIILQIVLLALSAFFSGSETALFSLDKVRLTEYRNGKNKIKNCIASLMDNYNTTLITLILGNMFVNVGLSVVNDELFKFFDLSSGLNLLLSLFSSVILLLIIGEITPKIIAMSFPEKTSSLIAFPLYYFYKLISPLIWIINKFFAIVLDLLGRGNSKPLDAFEYSTYLRLGLKEGIFNYHEIILLEQALALQNKTIAEVMKPTRDVQTISKTMSASDVIKKIQGNYQQFMPIVDKNIDDSNSILSIKKFILLTEEDKKDWINSAAILKTGFIPENANLAKALSTMNAKNVKVSLVVDEYGGVAGLIDLEDIYEELVGEIEDEFEPALWEIKKINKNEWVINGTVSLFLLDEILDIQIEDKYTNKTLNGVFAETFKRMPTLGDKIVLENIEFTVQKYAKNRIEEFKAIRIK